MAEAEKPKGVENAGPLRKRRRHPVRALELRLDGEMKMEERTAGQAAVKART